MFENVKESLKEKAMDKIIDRFLRNAGIEEMVEHPEEFYVISYVEDGGFTFKIRKKES